MKKFLFFVLIFMVFFTSGCGGGGGSDSGGTGNTEPPGNDERIPENPGDNNPMPYIPETSDDIDPIVDDPDDYLWLSIPSTIDDFLKVPNARYVSLDEPAARAYDTRIITPELLAKAKSHYEVTAEHHPRWSGFQLDMRSNFCYLENNNIETTAHAIELQGKYGFNMARIGLEYFVVDNSEMQKVSTFNMEGTQVNLNMLRYFDRCIAIAIKYNMHINFMFIDLPGFWSRTFDGDYDCLPEGWEPFASYSEVDLWTNPEKREKAKNVIKIIAERYKGIPNATFSICIGGANNFTLSGADINAPEPTIDDIKATFTKMAEGVREADPDRLIIVETGYNYSENYEQYEEREEQAAIKEIMDNFGNCIYQDNLGIGAYIYHGMNAWDNEEQDRQQVDFNNTTSRIVHYPVTWYGISDYLAPESMPYEITGLMPKGTRLDLHLKNLWGAKVIIKADDIILKEQITPHSGEVEGCTKVVRSYPVSEAGYRSPYVISVEIPEGTSTITISANDDGAVGVGLIEIVYPEEYAVENYYYKTRYSAYLDGDEHHIFTKKENSILISPAYVDVEKLKKNGITSQKIVLNPDDMSWFSPQPELIYERASKAEIQQQGRNLARFNTPSHVMIRHENATSTAAFWEDILAYYKDIYDMCEEKGFSIVNSWDWCRVGNFQNGESEATLNLPKTREFDIYEHFIWEFFQFFIDHQSKER